MDSHIIETVGRMIKCKKISHYAKLLKFKSNSPKINLD